MCQPPREGLSPATYLSTLVGLLWAGRTIRPKKNLFYYSYWYVCGFGCELDNWTLRRMALLGCREKVVQTPLAGRCDDDLRRL